MISTGSTPTSKSTPQSRSMTQDESSGSGADRTAEPGGVGWRHGPNPSVLNAVGASKVHGATAAA